MCFSLFLPSYIYLYLCAPLQASVNGCKVAHILDTVLNYLIFSFLSLFFFFFVSTFCLYVNVILGYVRSQFTECALSFTHEAGTECGINYEMYVL
jgi:hypothetical protein